uniref:Uncharacterized protein n=1 Tax=Arundo donax TaxID=35708 RepID=A0A0A9H6L1_ARUDO
MLSTCCRLGLLVLQSSLDMHRYLCASSITQLEAYCH